MRQKLQLKLGHKLSPLQIQLMKMVQMPTIAFEQKIEQELIENPALEKDEYNEIEDEYSSKDTDEQTQDSDELEINIEQYLQDDEVPQYKLSNPYNQVEENDSVIPFAQETTLQEYLLSQVQSAKLSEKEFLIAKYLIGSLDENGYLRRDEQSLANDIMFNENITVKVQQLVKVLEGYIHVLDPLGVGSRNLQECLMIQLKSKNNRSTVDDAIKIIKNSFKDLSMKHYQKILSKNNLDQEQLKQAMIEIEKLNPKPGKNYNTNPGNKTSKDQIIPDFTITITNNEIDLKLNSRNAPELKISNTYSNILKTYNESKNLTKSQKETVIYVKQKLDSAKWFIESIKQRQNTLIVTMLSIIQHQEDFFLTGDFNKLKPLILKDIAEDIGMDISTVSRVANSKYVETPYGTFLLRDMFSEGITNQKGEDISTKEIKKNLEEIIKSEDKQKPLTDEKLTKLLKEKGYPVARRTVAKYREQLNLPVARLRKEI